METALKILKHLWNAANLSHTPNLHCLLTHAPKQTRLFKGIGDILEDNVEKMHQIAGNVESRASRLKSANNRALAQAKNGSHISQQCSEATCGAIPAIIKKKTVGTRCKGTQM
jgi:hypothetical protein